MPFTVGVFSPFVGGDYYGALIRGINEAAVSAGGRILAIQTLDPGTRNADLSGTPRAFRRTSLGQVDGVVVLPGALSVDHLRTVQSEGRPLVLVGHTYAYEGFTATSLWADNRGGVDAAVAHLVAHGHERIAFAGFLGVADIQERYQGYVDAVVRHGLSCGPTNLLLETIDNHEGGGAEIADELLARDATAVVTGTDRNAMGLLKRLHHKGCRVPEQVAVIGFDDIAASRYLTPSLTSIRQPLGRMGATAFELVSRPSEPPADIRVPTTLSLRASCGCPAPPLTLTGEQARAQFEAIVHLQTTLNTQYDVDVELLATNTHDPRSLAWVAATPASAAVLGLWRTQRPVEDALHIAGTFGRDRASFASVGTTVPDVDFPPAAMLEIPDGVHGEIVFVVPVRGAVQDWGLLAAVGRIQDDTPPGREMMNHSGALLNAALDREVLMDSLRQREAELQRLAWHDPLTGLPNRAHLVNRLEQAARRAGRDPELGYCIVFIDLDGFKAVNDRHGHAAGDSLLAGVARRLTAAVRQTDVVARLGGDEFVLLLEGVRGDAHEDVIARVRTAFIEPLTVDGLRLAVGISVGVATSDQHTTDPQDLLRQADAAMYRAKVAGRPTATTGEPPEPR